MRVRENNYLATKSMSNLKKKRRNKMKSKHSLMKKKRLIRMRMDNMMKKNKISTSLIMNMITINLKVFQKAPKKPERKVIKKTKNHLAHLLIRQNRTKNKMKT